MPFTDFAAFNAVLRFALAYHGTLARGPQCACADTRLAALVYLTNVDRPGHAGERAHLRAPALARLAAALGRAPCADDLVALLAQELPVPPEVAQYVRDTFAG